MQFSSKDNYADWDIVHWVNIYSCVPKALTLKWFCRVAHTYELKESNVSLIMFQALTVITKFSSKLDLKRKRQKYSPG